MKTIVPMTALLEGVVEFLKSTSGMGLSANECGEQAEGQPPPSAGQRYVAVHDNGSSNEATETLDELFALSVTITLRTPYAPKDREKTIRHEIRELAHKVKLVLHGQAAPVILANGFMPSTHQDFCEPLRYLSTSEIQFKGPDWFYSEGTNGGDTKSGVAITVRFGKARLVTDIALEEES